MAIDSASVTWAQYAQMSNDPLIQKIVWSLLELGTVIDDWPIVTFNSLKVNGVRFKDNLPTVNWRKLNEATVVASGTPTQYAEQVYIASNAIDVDVKLMRDRNQIQNPMGIQFMAWARSFVYDVNDKFINNNHVTGDADAPVGIRYRLDNPTVYGPNSACKIDGAATDLSTPTAATTAKAFYYIDRLLGEIGDFDGNNVVIYMNRDLANRLSWGTKLMGSGGGFQMTTDAFDRRILTYRNARIRVLGTKADQSTEIITSTETNTGADGSSTMTSLYAVKYGEGYVQPWEFEPFVPQYIGQRSDEPTHERLFIDYAIGLDQQHTRAIGRVYDIKVS